jgi:two-component system, NarL family, response regulator DevR
VETIRRVAAGENLLDTEQAHELVAGCRVHGNADRRLRVLTPQERRILEHIAAGLTNRQIGKEMALAEKTVKDYVTAVQAELGIERRTQVAVFAVTDEGGGQRRHT